MALEWHEYADAATAEGDDWTADISRSQHRPNRWHAIVRMDDSGAFWFVRSLAEGKQVVEKYFADRQELQALRERFLNERERDHGNEE